MKTRVLISGCEQLIKESAAYNPTTGEMTITVIKPGFNKSKGRFYPADVLKRDHKIFEGAKMFVDHQTDSESKQRPEGSVNNWVGTIRNTWAEADGTVKAKVAVIDPPFKAKLDALNEKQMLGDMGVSIRAIGAARGAKVDGIDTTLVESFVRARSVDFVTFAGAGGRVEAIESESNDDTDVDLISEAQLRERRPDLITIIESHNEGKRVTIEQQLAEANQKLAAAEATNAQLTSQVAALTTQVQESVTAGKKAVAKAELTRLLSEATLPAKAKERLEKQFSEATEITGMKEAIVAEVDYIKAVGGPIVPIKKNNGTGENQEHTESDQDTEAQFKELKESFVAMGMSEKEAEIAAKGKK